MNVLLNTLVLLVRPMYHDEAMRAMVWSTQWTGGHIGRARRLGLSHLLEMRPFSLPTTSERPPPSPSRTRDCRAACTAPTPQFSVKFERSRNASGCSELPHALLARLMRVRISANVTGHFGPS